MDVDYAERSSLMGGDKIPDSIAREPSVSRPSVIRILHITALLMVFLAGAGSAFALFLPMGDTDADASPPIGPPATAAPPLPEQTEWTFVPAANGWSKVGPGVRHTARNTDETAQQEADIGLLATADVTTLSLDIENPPGTTGAVFLYQDDENYFRAVVSAEFSTIAVQRVTDGEIRTLKKELVSLKGQRYWLRVVANGGGVEVQRDGKTWWSTPNARSANLGRVGVVCNQADDDSSIYAFSIETA